MTDAATARRVAAIDELAQIQQAHHATLLSIRQLAGELIGEAWNDVGGVDDLALRRFPAVAASISDAARASTTTSAAAYMQLNDAARGVFSTIDLDVPPIRRGLDSSRVYQRSVVQARRTLAATGDLDQALNAGHARAVATGRTDVILTNREAISAGGERRPWVVGYRRILTGVSCALCASASTQRYKVARLHPIHPGCDCDVGEIFGTEDPGQIINEQLLADLQAAGRETGTPEYWRGPYMVDEDGAIRYRQVNYRLDPETGRRKLTASGSPERFYTPGERVVPEVRAHGELGELLTDRRHAFVAADDVADIELPAPPARAAPRVSSGPTSSNVLDEIPAEIADAASKTAGPKRRAAREFGVDDPDVVTAAGRWGVSPDEVLAARERIDDVKAAMYESAEQVQAEAFSTLDHWGALRVGRPPRRVPGKKRRGGEYDWLDGLHPSERRRLSRAFWTDDPGFGPDQVAQMMAAQGARVDDVDDAMRLWLDQTRRYESAGAVRRGKLPSANAYSDAIDPGDLVPIEGGYDAGVILRSVDPLDIAGHIAKIDRELLVDEARDYLTGSIDTIHGPPPFRMSFQAWEAEVRTLEYGLREFPAEMPGHAADRLAELVPAVLDDGQDFEDLYAAIVHKARQAEMEVPDHVGIPWA